MSARAFLVCLAVLPILAGCENQMEDMYDQVKNKPLSSSPQWPDGHASRPRVADTVAFSAGTHADVSSGWQGELPTETGHAVFTREALTRGRERFNIYCTPCHGAAGDGNGYITERGFPHPPTYHSERLRGVSDAYIFDVITHGYGVMYPYGDRVSADDRWAIVAYIRALQLSRHATLSDVPEAERAKLDAERGRGGAR
jgi:mono/diheme cytochrome c family protein